VELTVIHCCVHVGPWLSPRDEKEHLLLGFSSVWVLPSVRIWFGYRCLQSHKIWVQFQISCHILCFEFG